MSPIMQNKPELLAPAGSLDAFYAAVQSGADAVYLGVGSFHARAFSQKISFTELKSCVNYAHMRSVRVYLTLNTILSEDEIEHALNDAKTAYLCGIDAVIVQDQGLAKRMHDEIPDLPLHASTQMNIYSPEMLQWAGDHHFKRVVLPRELSADAIGQRVSLANKNNLEVEVFIHGALCMCYSGLCLFSALHTGIPGNRSGNKGTCSQPCRMAYDLISKDGNMIKNGRLLSPKDRWTVPLIYKLIESGVHSFKIEGRMKDAGYVQSVVSVYRVLIDSICSGSTLPDISDMEEDLLLAFNRGGNFTTHYLSDTKKDHYLSGNYPGKFGIRLGTLMEKKEKEGILVFQLEKKHLPVRGDVLSIRRDDHEVCSFPIGKMQKTGDLLEIKGLHQTNFSKLNITDVVYQMTGKNFLLPMPEKSARTPVSFTLQTDIDHLIVQVHALSSMYKNTFIEKTFPLPEGDFPALHSDRVKEQLQKTGDTAFETVQVDMEIEKLTFPISFINAVRRTCLESLSEKMNLIFNSRVLPEINENAEKQKNMQNDFKEQTHVHYDTIKNAADLCCGADMYSFTISDVLNQNKLSRIHLLSEKEPDAQFWLWIPGAFTDAYRKRIVQAEEQMDECFGSRYKGIIGTDCRFHKDGKQFCWSHEMNITNHFAFDVLSLEKPIAITLSYELTEEQIISLVSKLSDSSRSIYLTLHRYGSIPLMQTEFCPVYSNSCNCSENLFLRPVNSENELFPVLTDPFSCSSRIMSRNLKSISDCVITACKKYHQPMIHLLRFSEETESMRKALVDKISSKIEDVNL